VQRIQLPAVLCFSLHTSTAYVYLGPTLCLCGSLQQVGASARLVQGFCTHQIQSCICCSLSQGPVEQQQLLVSKGTLVIPDRLQPYR
jgi:hypothetical protein